MSMMTLLVLFVVFCMQNAVASMISNSGPEKVALPPQPAASTVSLVVPRAELKNGFVGIGMTLGPDGSILAVRSGSPAHGSIRAGDVLLMVGPVMVTGSASKAARALAEAAAKAPTTAFVLLRPSKHAQDVPSNEPPSSSSTMQLWLLVDMLLGASGALGLLTVYFARQGLGKAIAHVSDAYKGVAVSSVLLWTMALMLRLQPFIHSSSSSLHLLPEGKHALLVALSALSVVVPSVFLSACALRNMERRAKGAIEGIVRDELAAKAGNATAKEHTQRLETALAELTEQLQGATTYAFDQAARCMQAEARLALHMDLFKQPQPAPAYSKKDVKKVAKHAHVRRRQCPVHAHPTLDIIDEDPREQ